MIYKIIITTFIVLSYYSCSEKKEYTNTIIYYKDFNPFTLEGINSQNGLINSNPNSKLYKINDIAENKKTVTIPCCNDNEEGAIREYNYDGRAWVWSFDFNVEGCHQYAYVYVYDNKMVSLRYCGNPFKDAHYFLKAYAIESKNLRVEYGFEDNIVINQIPWKIIDDKLIIRKAAYKNVTTYNLKEGNILEEYYYNYYGVEIDIGPKQYEKKEYYDLGNNSIYQFFNCQYCFKPIEK